VTARHTDAEIRDEVVFHKRLPLRPRRKLTLQRLAERDAQTLCGVLTAYDVPSYARMETWVRDDGTRFVPCERCLAKEGGAR
jgi:hypothetical protein